MLGRLIALLLLISPAFADEIDTNLPDNTSGLITPQVMRNTLHDINSGVVNVKLNGAKCDGVTDDTTAIQNAANTVGTTAVVGTLIIPGKCKVTSKITVLSRATFPSASAGTQLLIQCVGNGSGFVWGGSDNAGPMLQLGDGTGSDQAFEVRNCSFGGASSGGAKPNTAIAMAQANNVSIHDNQFGWVHDAIKCTAVQCLLGTIDHNIFGGCFNTCIEFPTGIIENGITIIRNEFALCGNYCISVLVGDTLTVAYNDFEGNVGSPQSDVGGSVGSINIGGSSSVNEAKILFNRFEDANTAGGTGFRSVTITRSNPILEGNGYGFNATYPGGPNYYIAVLTASQPSFLNEYIANAPGSGSSGFYVDEQSTSGATWIGGVNCDSTKIFGDTGAADSTLSSACSQNAYTINTAAGALRLIGTGFGGLPGSPTTGMVAFVNDGLAANCGDGTCNTWGTAVTGGGGFLHLLVWWDGAEWNLFGKHQ